MTQSTLNELTQYLHDTALLSGTTSLLHWDFETYMPRGAVAVRSKQLALLSTLVHERRTSKSFLELVEKNIDLATGTIKAQSVSKAEEAMLKNIRRDVNMARALPTSLVAEIAETQGHAHEAWVAAKKDDNFTVFAPWLEKLIALATKQANYLKTHTDPYDTLLDQYEAGILQTHIDPLFNELKTGTMDVLANLKKSGKFQNPLTGIKLNLEEQKQLNEDFIDWMGLNRSHTRLDISAHPFSTSFHPTDTRITTRYHIEDPLSSLGSTIHEAGHNLYELQLPSDFFGTPLCEAAGYGVHESQSRFWEIFVGKSHAFLSWLYQHINQKFPHALNGKSFDEFYEQYNQVTPSLIRVEADEVTYNLHIIARYEIEKKIFKGQVKVSELPELWNATYQNLLGVNAGNAAQGVLQDSHWAGGAFGYFPSYTLGNLMAAQIHHAVREAFPQFDQMLLKGDMAPVKDWLHKNIHQHGRQKPSLTLIKDATGADFSCQAWLKFLRGKYLA